MAFETIELQAADGVATVTLNRPKRANAMNAPMWRELRAVFAEIDARPDVRVAILRGAGPHFCAGIDLDMLGSLPGATEGGDPDGARVRDELRRVILGLQDDLTSIERCRKPVIGAIHGVCVGGGVDLAAACDLRYCSADARFSVKEIDMGLVADVGSLQRLPRLIGDGLTRELAYTGRDVTGEEARAIRLVNDCLPDRAALDARVAALAASLAAKSPLALRGTKAVINHAREHTVAEGLEYVAMWNAAVLVSEDLKEAVAAFREKRPARYRD